MPKKTCFVISPIGPEESEIRTRANDFLELLVEPALQKFDFEVIRADKIQQPTAITGDIIRYVQESDLCVIDLTDSNPNVFYECGRRHETGKPFIQLIEKESLSKLPFDVAGIRTIPYDLSNPRNSLKSVQELQMYIQGFIDSGFKTGGAGESLSSIAQGLERVERKLNIIIQAKSTSPSGLSSGPVGTLEDFMLSPHELFRKAVQTGDVSRAFSAAQRFGQTRDKLEYMAMMGLLTSSGYEPAFDALDSLFQEDIMSDQLNETGAESIQLYVTSMRRYYEDKGDTQTPVNIMEEAIEKIKSMKGDTSKIQAFVHNQIGMNKWLDEDLEQCVYHTLRATDLNPNEPAYVYNLALAYQRTGDEPKLSATLKKLKGMETDSEDHKELLARHGM